MTNPIFEKLCSQSLRQSILATLLLCFGLTLTFVVWQQATSTTPTFAATLDYSRVTLSSLAGVCVSLLMVACMVTIDNARSRAVARATEMTKELAKSKNEAEAALREATAFRSVGSSEVRFRSIVDVVPLLIWTSRQDGKADYFNEPWLRFTGKTFVSEVLDGWHEGIHPDDQAIFLESYKTAFRNRREFEIECRMRRHDGEYRMMIFRGNPQLGAADRFLGFVGVSIDLTDLRDAHHKAEAANHSKSVFLTNMSHETRTPLTMDRIDTVGSVGKVLTASNQQLLGRILFAEDGTDNQRMISHHLKKAGAQVDIAENGLIALQKINESIAECIPYDLLISDMQMPEMDGYTLASTLRNRGFTIGIVAITAHAMAQDLARCLDAGCDAYATKPIDKANLIAICQQWIGKTSTKANYPATCVPETVPVILPPLASRGQMNPGLSSGTFGL